MPVRTLYLSFALVLQATVLWAAPSEGIAVPYKMPADGQLTLGLFNTGGSLLRWIVKDDYRGWDMAQPYLAPEGAAGATVIFGMTTLAEGRRPKLFLDDVELVDVTGAAQ